MTPNLGQRLEGLAIFIAAIVLYARVGRSWWIYTIFATLPDVAIAGYLLGRRIGASVYNTVHLGVWPIAIGAYGFLQDSTFLIAVSLAWASHIGIDRFFGFGLKYATGFKDTHLSSPTPTG